MKKVIRKLIVTALVLGLCLSSSGLSVLANEINDAKNQKTDLEKKKSETEAMLAELEQKKSDTLVYIQELDKKMADIEARIGKLDRDIAEANDELERTRIELEEAKVTEANQYDSMKRRIQYMYINGNDNYFQMLMESENMADFLNNSEYVKTISDYDRNMLSRYTEAKETVIKKEKTIENKIVELEKLNAEVEYEKQTVEVLINDKNVELEKYNASINTSEESLDSYTNAIEEQERLIEELLEAERKRIEEEARRAAEAAARAKAEAAARAKAEAEAKAKAAAKAKAEAEAEEAKKKQEASSKDKNQATSKPNDKGDTSSSSSSVSSSGYAWPVPSSGRITCKFGYRDQPTAGASTNHKGIDIGATSGSDIVATKGGTVIKSSYGAASGYYVMIYHGDGIYSYYMHCSKLLVEAGDTVNRGDVIALVGSTGVSTGPHLHFAITVDGVYVNPSDYVKY